MNKVAEVDQTTRVPKCFRVLFLKYKKIEKDNNWLVTRVAGIEETNRVPGYFPVLFLM